ncbi:MAG TPA: RNA polymerase sigma factor region1.1 domain-containing protein, partial [Kiritimatiellia bacterium]|nr:RNA polymerase sigma factor region1.1 domain-containing protein [Kiritimatiellia bacterium]
MASKSKKKSVATKTVSKKSPKPAPKAAAPSTGKAASKKLPVRSGKSAAKSAQAAAADKSRLAPPPVPSAKEALGKKNPDYMLQIISHARDRGGKIARDELNDLLPAEIVSPDEIERVEEKLRGLGIEIVRDTVEIETAAPTEK